MAKLDGLETILDFLKGLQPKVAAQIAKKVLALNLDTLPAEQIEFNTKFEKESHSRDTAMPCPYCGLRYVA